MATQRQIAEHLGVTQPTVAKLVGAGVFETRGRGGLDLDACRRAYLARLREEAAGRAAYGGADCEEEELDLVAERARLAAAQADRVEMENDVTRGRVVPSEDAIRIVTDALAKVRTRILAIPSECAAQFASARTPAAAEAVIRRVVIDALTELSTPDEVVKRVRARRPKTKR